MDLALEAKKNLEDFKRIADSFGMRFMLMEGNLLGAYRDGGFCKGDENDIDLGIMDDQFNKFAEVADELGRIGFNCKKYVFVDGVWHGGCWERNGNHIDIMRMLKDGNIIYNIGEMGGLRYDYSADIFSNYGKITFLGMELETVGNIEKFLNERYGNWKVKDPNYSYRDPKSSPSVAENKIVSYNGLRFYIRSKSHDEHIIYKEVMDNSNRINNPKVFVDIGAHIGGSSILAASQGAKVYAYEPSFLNFNQLRKNVALNGYDIDIFNKGVGVPGKAKLYHHPTNFGCFSLNKDNTTGMLEEAEEIDVISIKDVFKDIEHCDMLKIDCEGAEELFYKDIPTDKVDIIFIEIHKTGSEIPEYLSKFYKVEKVFDGGYYFLYLCQK